jgi:arylsulfatase A-like enzyme
VPATSTTPAPTERPVTGALRARRLQRILALLVVTACVAGALVALVGGSAVTPAVAAPAKPRPNVVYILVDDMRSDELRYLPKTRRLLARKGMSFPQAISPHPLCCPARAEILSAQYAQNNGVQHNAGRWGGHPAFDDRETLPVWAQRAGYRTAFHGKYMNKYNQWNVRERGWNVWDPVVKGSHNYRDFTFFNGDRFRNDYITTRLTKRAVGTIKKLSGRRPFLMMLNHLAPHQNQSGGHWFGPPKPQHRYAHLRIDSKPGSFASPSFNEKDMSDKTPDIRDRRRVSERKMMRMHRARVRTLASVDDSVAKVVRTLAQQGELTSTYIVFTSDNGYALGEHRLHKKNWLYDEVLSVPMLVRGPGIERGSTSHRVATLVDLSETLVDITGSRPGLATDGESLWPTLRGRDDAGRDTTLIQTGKGGSADVPQPGWEYRGVTTRRYIYARNFNNPANEFLYDRATDPFALENVVGDPRYAAVRAELLRRTEVLMDCSGSSCNQQFGPVPAPTS